MATNTTNLHIERSPANTFTASVMAWFEAYAVQRSRRSEIEALEAKSDAELRAMGLTRARIVQYVFRDLYYI